MPDPLHGWVLDLYADPDDGLTLWLLPHVDDPAAPRRRLHQPFPITFYAGGPFPRLRALWRFLENQPLPADLARVQREHLFDGPVDVLAITAPQPLLGERLAKTALAQFPDLDYYDTDMPLWLRYTAVTGVFPLAYCAVTIADDGRIAKITPLESRWEVDLPLPPLRILRLVPNSNPQHRPPTHLGVRTGGKTVDLPLKPFKFLPKQLAATLKRVDPDLILTQWGDTYLFPLLAELAEKYRTPFNPNRDLRRQPQTRQEHSYSTYGNVVYRGAQTHLVGRWHIDAHNAMMFDDTQLAGIFEQARVTALPVQEVARRSPGAGITAMQMLVALERGVLIPYQKQVAEESRSLRALMRADRGGMVYQPLIGVHQHVAEIDFVSMYPAIMARYNISPETVGAGDGAGPLVPEIGMKVDQAREGIIPQTVRPLLYKRIAIKERLAGMSKRDCRYAALKARSTALKWLLVVAYGYLGYKRARFGRINAYEAVTAYSRECLLRAKEAAEDLGFTVLHMYIDSLFVQKPGLQDPADLQPLLAEVMARTELPIALEGIYRWVCFLPSRMDPRVPVPNRYFGVFLDGARKVRGIEARQHSTAPFIAAAQEDLLARLGRMGDVTAVPDHLPQLLRTARAVSRELHAGRIPLPDLLVQQRLSRELDQYRSPSPAAQAALQLQAIGKPRRPGQKIRFVFTREGVWAWDLPGRPSADSVDTARYETLLRRAMHNVLSPFGVSEKEVASVMDGRYQLPLPLHRSGQQTGVAGN